MRIGTMNRLNLNIISRPSFASSSSSSCSSRTTLAFPVLLTRSYHSTPLPPPLRTSFHPTKPIRPLPKWIGIGIGSRSASTSTSTSNIGPDTSSDIGLGLPPSSSSSIPLPRSRLKITPPDLDAVQREGYLDEDVKLVPEDQAWLNLTPDAIAQLEKITSREPADVLAKGKLALRVGVESGGCHGYQYTMALTEERGVDDYIMQPEGVNCIPVVVDLISLGLLKGATLHHATELIGSSFRLQDNPQAKEGGACGCGVSWEAKT